MCVDLAKLFQEWFNLRLYLKYCNGFTINEGGDVSPVFNRLTLALQFWQEWIFSILRLKVQNDGASNYPKKPAASNCPTWLHNYYLTNM